MESTLSQTIRDLRAQQGLTQQQLADRLGVSRAAVAKWESGKGIPDISNLIRMSEEFGLSLDELICGDQRVEAKLASDSAAKKWHLLVIAYLVAIVVYIAYFALVHRIFMLGFLVATLFMLGIEAYVLCSSRIAQKRALFPC